MADEYKELVTEGSFHMLGVPFSHVNWQKIETLRREVMTITHHVRGRVSVRWMKQDWETLQVRIPDGEWRPLKEVLDECNESGGSSSPNAVVKPE